MFLFESSKDKQLKKIIQTKFNEAISSQTKYQSNKQIISNYCSSSDKKSIEKFVDLVKETIKDEDTSPKAKYYAIKMLQDVMRIKNHALGNYVVKKILKRLVIFAEYKKQSKDQKRGKLIFGKVKPSQEDYANKFHLTVLSCLEEWGTTWPKGMEGPHLVFKQKYEQLMKSKVTFPKIISNAPQVLKQKISKDKVDMKSFNQPKKFISPDRKDSRQKRESNYNSNNAQQALSQNKIVQINRFMLKIDESFNLLEQLSMEQADPDVLLPVVQSLRNQMNEGDNYVAELMSYNKKQFQPVINDIIADFQFIEEIDYRVKNLKSQRNKRDFIQEFKIKFQERRQRRNQNQLRASIINKSLEKNKSFERNNSSQNRKSQEKQVNFYYPQQRGNTNQRDSNSKSYKDSIKQESQKKISNKRQSQRSQRSENASSSPSVQQDQPTGKFKTFRHQETTANIDNYSKNQNPTPNKIPNVQVNVPPQRPSNDSNRQDSKSQSSNSMNNSSSIPYPPPQIKRELSKPPVPPPNPPASSSENIHSTSIMKKFQSSNLINQSSNSNSNSKQKSGFSSSQNPFSGPSKSNAIKSNPFESNEVIKKQFQSNNMFSSFGKSSLKQSIKDNNSKQKQVGYGRIEQNIYESEGNISDRKKASLIGNPFDGDSIFSVEKQKTNPFDESVEHQFQSYVSNPFSTNKSFMQKSNPFMSDSISSKSSQQVPPPFQVPNNVNQKSQLEKSDFEKSIFDKNNSEFSNFFMKKSKLDFNFDLDDKKNSNVFESKAQFKESDFIEKKSLKEDFFAENFPDKPLSKGDKTITQSFFDQFNPNINITTNVQQKEKGPDQFFADVKASNILTKKEMTTSKLQNQFNWFQPQKKQNPFQNPISQNPIYPQFSQNHQKTNQRQSKQEEKNIFSLNQFNPPEINFQTTPKQSRISQSANKQLTNPWPEVDDLNISQFPVKQSTPGLSQILNQIQNINQNSDGNQIQNQNLKLNIQNVDNNSPDLPKSSRRQQNPFGLPNPQFQNSFNNKNIKPQQSHPLDQFQLPTNDKEQFLFQNFRAAVQSGGSPWNPYKKNQSTSTSPTKSRQYPFQIRKLQLQLKEVQQVYQHEYSTNKSLQEQVLGQRISYNSKLKQLQAINSQKQQYKNLIKKSKEIIFIQESKIAEESKTINKLQVLKDKKNNCLKKLFELQSQRYSVNQTNKSNRTTSSKVNKFIAFNQTAKRMNSLATSQKHLSVKDTLRVPLFHHKH